MLLAELSPVPLPEGLDLPEEVFIDDDLSRTLAEVAARYLGDAPIVVSEPKCLQAAEAGVGSGIPLRRLLLPEDVHADDEAVAQVVQEAGDATGILAVGSGTVNDIAKLAATRMGIPYVVLGTAASMNGYASGVAAILSDGLKTTVTARPPRAILLSTKVLRDAPPELARAGLGDLLSKPVSMADWWLAHRMEGAEFSELPGRIVDAAVESATVNAAGLPAGDLDAFEALATALVLSGVSMVVAGSSSPASGGEHLVSHFWDMEALAHGRDMRLHGAQVGVASIVCASLYRRILDRDSPEFPPPAPWRDEETRIRRQHGALAPTVLGPAERKLSRAAAWRDWLLSHWPQLRAELRDLGIPESSSLRRVLAAAGAPHRLTDLGCSRIDARRALLLGRDIRDRLTVLDLAFAVGILPAEVDEILDEAGV